MKEKLKKALRNSKVYQLEECTIDILMRIDNDCICCEGCFYTLLDSINNGDLLFKAICEIELIDDLCGVI